jgi:hypothetical protein
MEDKEQKWWLDEGKPLGLVIPLGVEKYAKIFPGNIILLEGEKSQGKSTFALEFARLNKNIYLKDPEFSKTRVLKLQTFKRVWFDFPGEFLRTKNDIIIRRLIVIYAPKNN